MVEGKTLSISDITVFALRSLADNQLFAGFLVIDIIFASLAVFEMMSMRIVHLLNNSIVY